MADIQLIKGAKNGNPSDSLPTMYDKVNKNTENINNQVVNHEGRLGSAEAAVSNHGSRISEAEAELITQDNRISNIIAHNGDGTKDTELIDARGGEAILSDRLDKTDEQLADSASELRLTQSSPLRGLGACLTFVDDDVMEFIRVRWQPILDAKNINISFAVIPSKVDTSGYMTKAELLALQATGNDLLSHGMNGIDVPNTDLATVDADFRDGQAWMKVNGMNGYEYVVYSGGLPNTRVDVKNLARKYYKYGIGAWTFGTNYNATPVDNWCLARVNEDGSDLATLKGFLDQAIANNGWLIVMTHSHIMTSASIPKLESFIDYARANGVPILPFTEAAKRKGNAIALGERTQTDSKFISVEGDQDKGLFVKNPVNSHLITAPITAYPKDSVTHWSVDAVRDTFKGQGGTVVVFRNSNSDVYSYRTFKPINENIIYLSRWDTGTVAWTAWKPAGSEYVKTVNVALNAAHTGTLQYSIDIMGRVWMRGSVTLGVATTIGTIYAEEALPDFETPLLFRNFTQNKNSIGSVIAPNGIIYIDSDTFTAGDVIKVNMMYQA
jgi:peptidoglycan/xylan/chitin deacetylase (PgdA/CDA1 family)